MDQESNHEKEQDLFEVLSAGKKQGDQSKDQQSSKYGIHERDHYQIDDRDIDVADYRDRLNTGCSGFYIVIQEDIIVEIPFPKVFHRSVHKEI